METSERFDLTKGNITATLIRFFLPVAAGTIVQQLYNTADGIIVGRFVGTEALAAVGGSVSQITNLLIGFFVALTGGASVVIAHYYGEKDSESVGRCAGTSVTMCAALGLIVTFIGEVSADFLLGLMKTPPETMVQAAAYLRICFAAVAPVLIYNMGSGIMRASGDSKRPFWYLFVCCMTNIVLDLLFVAVFDWGVEGAAIATAISQVISCILILHRLFTAKEAYRITGKSLRPDRKMLRRMLYLGVPAGLEHAAFGVSNMIVQVGVNNLGTTVVAAWALTGKVDGIYWAISSACGTAVMNFVGQNYGAGRMDRVRACVKKAMLLFAGCTVAMSVLLLTLGRMALPFFTEDPLLIDTTWEIMTYFVPYYFTWTVIEVLGGTLRGGGDAIVPVIINALGIAGLRVIWVWLIYGRLWHTLMGLSLCYLASWLVTDMAIFIRYRQWSGRQRA